MTTPSPQPAVRRGRLNLLLLALAGLLMGATIGGFVYFQKISNDNATWLTLAKQLAADVTTISAVGRDATRGIDPDFGTLEALSVAFDENVKALGEGDPGNRIPPVPDEVRTALGGVADAWKTMKTAVDAILKNEPAFTDTREAIQNLNERVGSVAEAPLNPQQEAALLRIKTTAAEVLANGRDAAGTAARLHALAQGYPGGSGPGLREIAEPIVANAAAVATLQQNAAVLQGEALNVIANAKTLEQGLLDYGARFRLLPVAVIGAGVLALAFLAGFIVLFVLEARREARAASDEARAAAEKDRQQQQAILSLLDEIGTLADGDLTVHAKVTAEFTGAIADSINYAIDAMRELVGAINGASTQVAASASDTARSAHQMNEASEKQAQEVAQVTQRMIAASQQLQQVSARAEALAGEARQSVQVAHSGAETVGRAIRGMTALREQIQDTSKRIKRLGESSQEIGNIIEFINDIAEQTNTLALNASIQAAMAGEQGRGFAVVAGEVQRLAERAANATRQIETLVKTIQADTSEAIVSMERSTANVVAGAQSAEAAGGALSQIESSSQQLSQLITEISGAAREQSAQTDQIAGAMRGIREVAIQTAGSAAQTARAVGELNQLSEKLHQSVAGFRLPQT